MRYFVVALGDDDFVDPVTDAAAERLISAALTWDSPATVVAVPWSSLKHGVEPYEAARLGRGDGR